MYIAAPGVVEPIGSTGTLLQYGNYDDTYLFRINNVIEGEAPRTLPFEFKFFGMTYTQPYFNSNTYLTFGMPNPGQTGEAPCCPVAPFPYSKNSYDYVQEIFTPGIYIGANDDSWQQAFETPTDKTYRFRYEGYNSSSDGTVGNSNMIYEITFYKQQNPLDDVYVQIVSGELVLRTDNLDQYDLMWGIGNGLTGSENLYTNFYTLTPETGLVGDSSDLVSNNSYVIRFDSNGIFKNLYSGYHVEEKEPEPPVPPKPTNTTENTTVLILFLVSVLIAVIAVVIITMNILPSYNLQVGLIAFFILLGMIIAFSIIA